MANITSHHDGHGLNEMIRIEKDDPGPGGASHYFTFLNDGAVCGFIEFQKGPRGVIGSTPGATELAVLAVIRDRLESFQAGPYACEENAEALNRVNEAMRLMKERADKRAARGVLGTYQK
jgi:hypothetical protein